MTTEVEAAARQYLALGLSVIALSAKTPNGAIHRHGLHEPFTPDGDAPVDRHGTPWSIERAFNLSTVTGVGILTGMPYYVIDIDGEEGAVQWKDEFTAGDPSWGRPAWAATTGRGLHLYFHDAGGPAHPTTKLGPKLDFKGLGGYVCAPPSQHYDKDTGQPDRLYEWLLEPVAYDPVTQIPAALEKLLADRRFDLERKLATRVAAKPRGPFGHVDGRFYPGRSFEGVYKTMREAGEGNRNAVLYWAAYALEEDAANEDDFEALHAAALEVGLTARETRLTIRSARRKAVAGG